MCKTPKAPAQGATPPPTETPRPLALPEMRGLFGAGLRASNRNNLRSRDAAPAPSGLTTGASTAQAGTVTKAVQALAK